ncbi:uncharacterized protein BCR38DRAFT_310774, partial [Pseudomassariella vexata]
VVLMLAGVFVGLRFGARYTCGFVYGMDDWVLVAALLCLLVLGGFNLTMMHYGLGMHAADIDREDLFLIYNYLVASQCAYLVALLLVKTSILQLYRRIFPFSRSIQYTMYFIVGMMVVWTISILCLSFFRCKPIHNTWLPQIEGTCAGSGPLWTPIFNIITDVAILTLPISQIIKLQIDRTQKAWLCVVFLLGGFVIFVSTHTFILGMKVNEIDITWTLLPSRTWCAIETSAAIISACLPTMGPLLGKLNQKIGTWGSNRKANPTPTELITIGGTGAK